ncbi:hypothetical protein E3P99_02698 [Wallemia hederae]|uniref:N-acetyltransferase domain-containing protein n=1 Tax=Wallemia hederae TaxID=1540922 RepID=A0A4T0FJ27_9BASI|nr:hypothetical protein E3P99_02698 [Wallemia hederae]
MFDDSYIIDRLEPEELDSAYGIATADSDAATSLSREQLQYNHKYATDLLLGIFSQPRTKGLLGFVSSTLSNDDTLTEHAKSTHDPSGHTVLIHSLVVHPNYRRNGVATRLFTEYMRKLDESSYNRVMVQSPTHLTHFFDKFKFTPVIDTETQIETTMIHDITPQRRPTLSQADILAALNKPQPKQSLNLIPFTDDSSYSNFVTESRNSRNARCPRSECKSLVFLANEAEFKDLETIHPLTILLPNSHFSHPSLPPPYINKVWRLAGPMSFENITFSKIAPGTPPNVSKFLACGECEIGSLGWVDNVGCWIDMKRVLYE